MAIGSSIEAPLAPEPASRTAPEWAFGVAALAALVVAEGIGATTTEPGGWTPAIGLGTLVRLAAWLAVMPAAYLALDRLPLRRGVLIRNLSLSVGVAALTGLVQGVLASVVARGLGWLGVAMPADLVGPAALTELVPRAASQFPLFLFVPQFILARRRSARGAQLKARATERSLTRAQLHALAVELQPHFLFNTLNAIAGLVRSDPRTAETMLIRLSDLLRLTLEGTPNGESPLGAELERLDLYVALQQMRFGERLAVTTKIPPEIRDARVPAMVLQPLVENAIVHGIGPKEGAGLITITGRRDGDRLTLLVEDDGVGLPPESGRRERIGIGNTRARLAALFPAVHRFRLEPREGGGTRATVEIPYRAMEIDASADR